MDIKERFDHFDIEFADFQLVENKMSKHPDMHAFMMLDKLFDCKGDIISAAEHDIIYLNINRTQIETLSDDQILELSRCGVMYDVEYECLCMFV